MIPRVHPTSDTSRILLACFLALWCVCITSNALADENKFVITAEKAEVNQQQKIVTYSGAVIIESKDFELQADNVEYAQQQSGRVFRATGKPVRVFWSSENSTNLLNNARANFILYTDGDERTLDMSGDAYIEVDNDTMESDIIHYDFNSQLLKATGNKQRQVRFVITDQSGKN